MRRFILAIALLGAACTAPTHAMQSKEMHAGETQTGMASWYGPGLQGRRTASGETFDQNALTAAHRTWPLPSLVEVTNLDNKSQIIVRMNDRGPFADNRLIDVSRAAANALGFAHQGETRVAVRYLGAAPDAARGRQR